MESFWKPPPPNSFYSKVISHIFSLGENFQVFLVSVFDYLSFKKSQIFFWRFFSRNIFMWQNLRQPPKHDPLAHLQIWITSLVHLKYYHKNMIFVCMPVPCLCGRKIVISFPWLLPALHTFRFLRCILAFLLNQSNVFYENRKFFERLVISFSSRS